MTGIPEPQYTQTPNIFFDEMMTEMEFTEMKVFLAIVRNTLGWHRETHKMSITYLMQATGLSRQGVINGTAAAMARGVIYRKQKDGSHEYGLAVNSVDQNNRASQLSRPVLVNSVDQQVVNSVDQQVVNSVDPTKKDLKKDLKKGSDQTDGPSPDDVQELFLKAGITAKFDFDDCQSIIENNPWPDIVRAVAKMGQQKNPIGNPIGYLTAILENGSEGNPAQRKRTGKRTGKRSKRPGAYRHHFQSDETRYIHTPQRKVMAAEPPEEQPPLSDFDRIWQAVEIEVPTMETLCTNVHEAGTDTWIIAAPTRYMDILNGQYKHRIKQTLRSMGHPVNIEFIAETQAASSTQQEPATC